MTGRRSLVRFRPRQSLTDAGAFVLVFGVLPPTNRPLAGNCVMDGGICDFDSLRIFTDAFELFADCVVRAGSVSSVGGDAIWADRGVERAIADCAADDVRGERQAGTFFSDADFAKRIVRSIVSGRAFDSNAGAGDTDRAAESGRSAIAR